VKLINTDGMAFIGPGSEWFWTALSGIVLAVTFLAIYRQLSLQRSAGAIEQLNRIEQEYQSERMLRVALELAEARHAGIDPAHLPQVAVVALVNFWERVAILARRGDIDLELLWEGGSGFYCQGDWVRLLPWIEQKRTEDENPLQDGIAGLSPQPPRGSPGAGPGRARGSSGSRPPPSACPAWTSG